MLGDQSTEYVSPHAKPEFGHRLDVVAHGLSAFLGEPFECTRSCERVHLDLERVIQVGCLTEQRSQITCQFGAVDGDPGLGVVRSCERGSWLNEPTMARERSCTMILA